MSKKPEIGDLRVWWIPQVPGKAFRVPVESPTEAKKLLTVLADYDLFQLKNRIKPDYCNAGGLEQFQADEQCRVGGEWLEWYDEENDVCIDEWPVLEKVQS